MNNKSDLKKFVLKVVLLIFLVFVFFIGTTFYFLIPKLENAFMFQKRLGLESMTHAVITELKQYNKKVDNGEIRLDLAQKEILQRLRAFRYGPDRKDYFWITSHDPVMIMHPYRSDLEGSDVGDFKDPNGKKFFSEFVAISKASGKGHIDYHWPHLDNPNKIVAKIAYAQQFKPWGWIVCTTTYVHEIKSTISKITNGFIFVFTGLMILVVFLLWRTFKRAANAYEVKSVAEEALRKNEEKYRSLIENLQAGIARNTPGKEGRFIELNQGFAQMFGYTKEEMFQMTPADLYLNKEDRKKFSDKVIASDIVKKEKLQLVKKDKSIITVAATAKAIKDSKGEIAYFDLILEDITEQKIAEKEILKTEKLQSIGTLAGGIAHDFNNILTGVFGNIALAKLELVPDDEAFQLIIDAEESMTKATDLTQQLLTFARGGDPVKDIVTIDKVIKDTASFHLSGSNIKLNMQVDQNLLKVNADKDQISQVISNLVNNARHAMPDGGNLFVSLQNIELAEHEIKQLAKGNYILITIRDEGIGILDDHIEKIFDPYFSTKEMGSGMGLATSYSILQRHKGLITVSSQVDHGSTFMIYLPAVSEHREVDEKDTADLLDIATARILIMDDDEQVRNITEKMIHKFGFEVSLASEGLEAVELYEKAFHDNMPYDVVLMDLTIPGGMGGKDAVQKVLAIDPDANAVVISGYSNDPVLSNFEEYGFKGMLVKPFKIEELKDIIEKTLQ